MGTPKPTTAAGQLRDWLEWAGGRLAGVPKPGIVDRIEREARQEALDEVREGLLTDTILTSNRLVSDRIAAILDSLSPDSQEGIGKPRSSGPSYNDEGIPM